MAARAGVPRHVAAPARLWAAMEPFTLTLTAVRRAVAARATVVGLVLAAAGVVLLVGGFDPVGPTRALGGLLVSIAIARTVRERLIAASIPDEISFGSSGLEVRRGDADLHVRWDEIHRIDHVTRFAWLGLPVLHSTWAIIQLMSGHVLRVVVDDDTWSRMTPWMRRYRLVPWLDGGRPTR